jgi:hypothetical protein
MILGGNMWVWEHLGARDSQQRMQATSSCLSPEQPAAAVRRVLNGMAEPVGRRMCSCCRPVLTATVCACCCQPLCPCREGAAPPWRSGREAYSPGSRGGPYGAPPPPGRGGAQPPPPPRGGAPPPYRYVLLAGMLHAMTHAACVARGSGLPASSTCYMP